MTGYLFFIYEKTVNNQLVQKKYSMIWRKSTLNKYQVKINSKVICELDHIYNYIAIEKSSPATTS